MENEIKKFVSSAALAAFAFVPHHLPPPIAPISSCAYQVMINDHYSAAAFQCLTKEEWDARQQHYNEKQQQSQKYLVEHWYIVVGLWVALLVVLWFLI